MRSAVALRLEDLEELEEHQQRVGVLPRQRQRARIERAVRAQLAVCRDTAVEIAAFALQLAGDEIKLLTDVVALERDRRSPASASA